ncbi:MAG: hypothetical protein QF741_02050 [Candidatus Peribacteraceae bacterium]|jgi:hypothetical protein|nr:hypothetical protein [Candidatus Peribacteraceae bacterium]
MNLNYLIQTSPLLSEEQKASLIMMLPALNEEQESKLTKIMESQDELLIKEMEEIIEQATESQDFEALQKINLSLAPHAQGVADNPKFDSQK